MQLTVLWNLLDFHIFRWQETMLLGKNSVNHCGVFLLLKKLQRHFRWISTEHNYNIYQYILLKSCYILSTYAHLIFLLLSITELQIPQIRLVRYNEHINKWYCTAYSSLNSGLFYSLFSLFLVHLIQIIQS